uniref:Uncharacterized protein n=1 Tax=Anopheles quadriannulatus TaxID=34691 RepID=A0A182XRC3_ANOQN
MMLLLIYFKTVFYTHSVCLYNFFLFPGCSGCPFVRLCHKHIPPLTGSTSTAAPFRSPIRSRNRHRSHIRRHSRNRHSTLAGAAYETTLLTSG